MVEKSGVVERCAVVRGWSRRDVCGMLKECNVRGMGVAME